MIKGIKVMLLPNNKQTTLLFQYAGAKRFAYNWALEREKENYESNGNFIFDNDLRKEFTQLKKLEEFYWLNNVSNNVTKQAIKDACIAYSRFFKKQASFPKFKSKKRSMPSFYQDNVKIDFTSTHVKMEGFSKSKKQNKQTLNWIKLAEKDRIPYGENIKYINPRFSYDGLHWFVSVGVQYGDIVKIPINDGIGIDLGIKYLAICSDSTSYGNINKTKKIRKLEKRKKRLQHKVSRKYEMNRDGEKFVKTKNIIKLEKRIRQSQSKINGIRNNYIHQTTSEIVKREPSFITLEDLNIKGMMKNKHLSKAIQQQNLYAFKRQIQYKANWNGIEVRVVDRWYPSSKTCHNCGYINKQLELKDREWTCPCCKSLIDRDYNASLNLRDADTYKVNQVA